jgi:hypothetical protein
MTIATDIEKTGFVVAGAQVLEVQRWPRYGYAPFTLSVTDAEGWSRTYALPLPVAVELAQQLIRRLAEVQMTPDDWRSAGGR